MSLFFFSSRRRHTRCALVTGVQTCALPIWDGRVRVEPLGLGVLARLDREVAVAHQVLEPDLGPGGRGDGYVGLHPEGDQCPVALEVLDLLDLADGDPRNADVVALLALAGAGELGLVDLARPEPAVAHASGTTTVHTAPVQGRERQ